MNEIICSDSLVALKEMDDESVDIVLTSPPYNYGMEYDTHDDDGDADEYLEKILAVFVECKRVLKSGGRLIINIQPNYKQYFPTHHKITQRMIGEGMIWRGEIIWLKNNLRKASQHGVVGSHHHVHIYRIHLSSLKFSVKILSSILETKKTLTLLKMNSLSMSMVTGLWHQRLR